MGSFLLPRAGATFAPLFQNFFSSATSFCCRQTERALHDNPAPRRAAILFRDPRRSIAGISIASTHDDLKSLEILVAGGRPSLDCTTTGKLVGRSSRFVSSGERERGGRYDECDRGLELALLVCCSLTLASMLVRACLVLHCAAQLLLGAFTPRPPHVIHHLLSSLPLSC